MAKYNWSFANVGGVTRVRIQSAEDIRHLGELDKKMWTVLSCPVNGLEISSESLSLMDGDGDGKLRVKEVIATADYLCAALKEPQSLFEQSDSIALDNIADEAGFIHPDNLAVHNEELHILVEQASEEVREGVLFNDSERITAVNLKAVAEEFVVIEVIILTVNLLPAFLCIPAVGISVPVALLV